jgi:hypothetical protein
MSEEKELPPEVLLQCAIMGIDPAKVTKWEEKDGHYLVEFETKPTLMGVLYDD